MVLLTGLHVDLARSSYILRRVWSMRQCSVATKSRRSNASAPIRSRDRRPAATGSESCPAEIASFGRTPTIADLPLADVDAFMTLEDLGVRICIMGPSNSGKSTLAYAIGQARDMQVVHLDQLHHLPNTDWSLRPPDEFARLHDEAIMGSRWIVERNYSRLIPQRLERATGFILLDASTTVSLYRYLQRCWLKRDRRRSNGLRR